MPRYRQDELDQIQQAYLTGCELAKAGSLEDALRYFDAVLGRLPRRRRDRVYRVGEAMAPRHTAEKVSWLPSVFRDALLAKAYCLNGLGRFDDAFVLLERAVELDPENPLVYAELGYTLGSCDNLDEARIAFGTAAELDPMNPAHLRALAHLALVDEDFEGARQLARQALELDPLSVPSLHQLAYAEYRLGNLDVTITMLEQAIELVPFDQESAVRLAGALREAGRIREAIARTRAYLEHEPDNPEALGLLTELLQQGGVPGELVQHAESMLTQNAYDAGALDLLAWGHYQQGNLADALKPLRTLILLEPEQPYHHIKLSMVYQAQGQYAQAMAALLRATTLDVHDETDQVTADAISNLDQLQIDHILQRARADESFRRHLRQSPDQVLHQMGFLLSPFGQQMLHSFDLDEEELATLAQPPAVPN